MKFISLVAFIFYLTIKIVSIRISTQLICTVDGDGKNWHITGSWYWIRCYLLTCRFRQKLSPSVCQSNR